MEGTQTMKLPVLVAATCGAIALSGLPATNAHAFVDGGSTPNHSCLTTMKVTPSGSKLVFAVTSTCEYMGGPYGAINVGVTVKAPGIDTKIGSNVQYGGPKSVTTKVTVPNPPGTQDFSVMVETDGYGAYNWGDAAVKDHYLLWLHRKA